MAGHPVYWCTTCIMKYQENCICFSPEYHQWENIPWLVVLVCLHGHHIYNLHILQNLYNLFWQVEIHADFQNGWWIFSSLVFKTSFLRSDTSMMKTSQSAWNMFCRNHKLGTGFFSTSFRRTATHTSTESLSGSWPLSWSWGLKRQNHVDLSVILAQSSLTFTFQ